MDVRTLIPATTLARKAKTPFPGETDAYHKAREALVAEEVEFRRHMTRLAEQRRSLPPGAGYHQELSLQGCERKRTGFDRLVWLPRRASQLFLDVRPAARAPLPDVHKLAGRRERQCARCQAARRAQDSRPQ